MRDHFAVIRKIIVADLEVNPIDVHHDTAFLDLGADSLDMTAIMLKCEEAFGDGHPG